MQRARATSRKQIVISMFWALFLGTMLLTTACNKKHIAGPEEYIPGQWSLVMRAPAVMYLGSQGHVANEIIPIRLYTPSGAVGGGKLVNFVCSGNPNHCTPTVTTVTDTSAVPEGSNPALMYYGVGGSDGRETITATAIIDGDTVRASATFRVVNQSGTDYTLRLTAPSVFHRGTSGLVENGVITVRLLSNHGVMAPATMVYSTSRISPDGVSGIVTTTLDTIGANACGTNPPLTYQGAGPANPDSLETVSSFAVIGTDTMRAQVQFYVRPMPRLVLVGPEVMYRDTATGRVPNQVIPVRLYGERGTLLNDVSLYCTASLAGVGDNWVTPTTSTRSDTITFPAGAYSAVMYYGRGSVEADQQETVTCWCRVGTDTIRTHTSFYVRNP